MENKNRRNIQNNKNRLLYDPNDRLNRRLGNFPMQQDIEDEESVEPEENEETSLEVETNDNIEEQTPTVVDAGKQVVAAQGAAIKKQVKNKLLAFIASNPWVIAIIIGGIFLLFLLLWFSTKNDKQQGGYFDSRCNYNLTEVTLSKCDEDSVININIDEYALGVASYYYSQGLSDEAIKAIIIIAKTNALSYGEYNSDTKEVSIDDCSIGYDYENENSDELMTLYEDVQNYLYVSSSYNESITSLNSENALAFDSEILDQLISYEEETYNEILDAIYNDSDDENSIEDDYRTNLFLGDSRMKGMEISGAINSNNTIYGIGYGYNWLVGNGNFSSANTNATKGAINGINSKLTNGKAYNIIIWLGVNDYTSVPADTYFNKYYELATGDWKDSNIYIVSVGPVDDAKAASVNNNGIDKFNNEMSNLISSANVSNLIFLNINYQISSYDSAGLHYSNDDYKNIHTEIENAIGTSLSSEYRLYDLADYCTYYTITENDAYWWPIGSFNATKGNIYGGEPPSTEITNTFDPNGHPGIDIATDASNEYVVVATQSGTVTKVFDGCDNDGDMENTCGGSYGNHVYIEHADGVETRYAHLYPGSITVNEGDSIQQGEMIGMVGNSGQSSGPHLHFEVRINGSLVNPLDYVSQESPRPINQYTYTGVLDGSTGMEYVCKSLLNSGFSENAVAGMLVNIRAEGGFKTNNLENCYEEGACCTIDGKKYGYCNYKHFLQGFATDEKYTFGIDNGTYPKESFVNDHAGYGLVQWTSSGRKAGLYDYAKSQNKSIADMDVQLGYVLKEIEASYSITKKYITGNYSAYDVAKYFCLDYESPYDENNTCPARARAYSDAMLEYVMNGCSQGDKDE